MNENTGLALGFMPEWKRPTHEEANAQKISDGIQSACLEIVSRIERNKETATDKELMDMGMALTSLVTAWNLVSVRAGYGLYPYATTGFDEEGEHNG